MKSHVSYIFPVPGLDKMDRTTWSKHIKHIKQSNNGVKGVAAQLASDKEHYPLEYNHALGGVPKTNAKCGTKECKNHNCSNTLVMSLQLLLSGLLQSHLAQVSRRPKESVGIKIIVTCISHTPRQKHPQHVKR